MTFRKAIASDNGQLVALTNATPMQGTISICIKREPDFFALLNKKGKPYVIVAEEDSEIIGCVSIVKEEMILLNKPQVFYYLCDLKVHPDHRNKKIATKLCHQMHNYLLDNDADWMLSLAAKGNNKVMPIMQGKSGIDGSQSLGTFIMYQLLPKKNIGLNKKYRIEAYDNMPAIINLYNEFNRRYVLHPVTSEESLKDCTHIAAFKNDKIVAAISLYDPVYFKQNVVIALPWYVNITTKLMRLMKPLFKFPPIPRKGEAIKILYAKAYAFLTGYEDAFIELIRYSRMHAYQNKYTFFSIAFHEADKLKDLIKNMPAFTFRSHEFIGSLKNNTAVLNKIKEGNVIEDFSLV